MATKIKIKRKPLPRGYGRYVVLFAHTRKIGRIEYMLEPLFSGEVVLPKDADTALCAKKGWIKPV